MLEAEARLLGFLRNKPLGPIIISGPASCGSSQLVHRTIDKVNSSGLHLLDCDKYASADTHKGGILNAFVRSSGYNMMPKILGDLKIGRDSGGSVNEGELQLCMKYYNEVIVKMATKNKGLRLPVVFIDQAREHTPALDQLLRAAAHATEQGVAHVVIAAQGSLTRKLDLTRSGFSERRRLILLDHAGKDQVTNFLVEKHCFKEEDADLIADEIGGNFTDLQNLVGLKDEPEMMKEILAELKADSLRMLELHLDERLNEAADLAADEDPSVKIEAWRKVERFWSLIDVLADRGRIERRTLSCEIFFQHSSEIDDMLDSGLLALVRHPPVEGYKARDQYCKNEHWITAASPRLLRAMEYALKCPRLGKLRSYSEEELQTVEASQRVKELGDRRTMITAELNALAGHSSSAKALARFEAVLDDSEAVLHDLKRVQLEYDDLRWNNPKDENKSEGSP